LLSLPMILDYIVLVKPDWESKEKEFVSKLNLNGKDSLILDLGANVGYYTALLSKLYPVPNIVAVEASPSIFSILKKTCVLNKIQNVTLINKAISDEDGSHVEFYEKHSMSTFLKEYLTVLSPGSDTEKLQKVVVQTLTIDNLVETMNFEEISLLKIDIEGAEVLALKGAMETLRKRKIKNILIEYHSVKNYDLLIKILEQLEYIYSVDSRYEISKDVKYVNGHIMARLN
jgi:FkbM family methyltransferase